MHIPDGFLNGKTSLTTALLAGTAIGVALWRTRRMPARKVPLLGLSAAFVFSAQMLNFPIPGGTSGHLLGGVLTAILLGPSAAILVLLSVLLIQCLLFADGGLIALGANVLNMGVIDSVVGYYIYRAVLNLLPGERGRITAVAFGAWCGAVVASVVCAGELAVSGAAPARVVFPAMLNVHMVIAVGEALITALVIAGIGQHRPALLDQKNDPGERAGGIWEFVGYGMIIATALATFIAPFASKLPDGLDHVAAVLGFGGRSIAAIRSPIADYHFPGLTSLKFATAIAGLAGTIIAFAAALVLGRWLVPRASGQQLSLQTVES
jgi:cobalt/nickel transport system permease protein